MSRNNFNFTGIIPILVTPFHEDESLDLESLERLIRFNAELAVDGVTVLGILGESNRLTEAERNQVISTAVRAAGKLPVIVGASHTGTAATIDLSRVAMELGATAVMISPSAQPMPGDKAVFEYFQRVADQISAPIVLQDYPSASQVHMSADLILRMVREIPAIAAVKVEAVPTPPKIAAIKAGLKGERPVSLLTGLGGLYGLFDLERGSDGFNTGFAFPEVLCAMLRTFRHGDTNSAREIFTRYLPLIVFEQQPGVAIRKEIFRRRNLLRSNRVRHPGATIDAATAEQLARVFKAIFTDTDVSKPLMVAAEA